MPGHKRDPLDGAYDITRSPIPHITADGNHQGKQRRRFETLYGNKAARCFLPQRGRHYQHSGMLAAARRKYSFTKVLARNAMLPS